MDKNFKRMLSDRLGMFVHFGLYSAFAGSHKGERIDGLGEWIQRRANIPIKEYEEFARENFRPSEHFARDLVRAAKMAGLKYVVLTSKHHDGFCLFKSEADTYNSFEFFGRDLCREVVDACREVGLEVGFYYSHALDWHEKNGAGNYPLAEPERYIRNRNYWDFPDDNIDFDEYFRRKCLPQVRELLTNYGEIKCIWFDYPHDITREQSAELRRTVKELQPDCLINSRIGFGQCDYFSLGDNGLPHTCAKVPTECLVTLNDTWGYKAYDDNYKSAEGIIEIICRTITAGTTLLLNVGPRGDGALTKETMDILKKISDWTERNKEAIYGDILPSPFKTVFTWGHVAMGDRALYLYPTDHYDKISISGIESAPVWVKQLGQDGEIGYSYENNTVTVMPQKTDTVRPVYKIYFSEQPIITEGLIVDSTKCALPVSYALLSRSGGEPRPLLHEYDVGLGTFGKNGLALTRIDTIHHWKSADDALVWQIRIEEAGEYAGEIVCTAPSFETYCAAAQTPVPCTLSVGEISHGVALDVKYCYNVNATGGCNMRYIKDAGVFSIAKAGDYTVRLVKNSDELGLGMVEVRLIKKG